MATLTITGPIAYADPDSVDHAALISFSSTSYTWQTTAGYVITAYSEAGNITSDGTIATGGTISHLQVMAPGGAEEAYFVSDLGALDLIDLTAPPNHDEYWRAILAGDTEIIAPVDYFLNISGDFRQVSGETARGGNDVFTSPPQPFATHYLIGDAQEVAADGTLHGGADQFTLRAAGYALGDVGSNFGTVRGGHDTFSYSASRSDTVNIIAGEAFDNDGVMTGGNDRITIVSATRLSDVCGDVLSNNAGTLYGGNDVIVFLSGRALIITGDAENLNGGTLRPGADTIRTAGADDTIHGDVRTVAGGAVVLDSLRTGNDLLDGGGGNDTLYGQYGSDVLIGGLGSDTLDGGTGVDTADYSEKSAAVQVTLNGSTAVAATVGGIAEDTLYNIENVIGGSGDDLLTGDGLANSFTGNAGQDTLDGAGGTDTASFAEKTASVVLTLNGAAAAVASIGGVAEDTVSNIENVIGGSAGDVLTGDGLANTLTGNGGADTLSGGLGNDILLGGAGADILDGGGGTDIVSFADKTVSVALTLAGATEATALVGGIAEDKVRNIECATGGSAADALTGSGQANILRGGAGNDTLEGAGGNDVLMGQAGADSLWGGAGNDVFDYDSVTDSGAGAGKRDTLFDFLAGDRINVATIDADVGLAGDQAFAFDTDSSFSAGEIRQIVAGSDLLLEFNVDGDAVVEMQILIVGRTTPLAAGDLVF